MNEDVLHTVIVETVRPFERQQFEEKFESFRCFDSYPILCVVQTFEQFWVDLLENLVLNVVLDSLHDFASEDDSGESKLVHPVVVKTAFHFSEDFLKVLMHFNTFNQTMIE